MTVLERIRQSDMKLFSHIHRYPNRSIIQKYARYVSASGDGYMFIILGVLLIIYKEYLLLQTFALAFVLERFIYVFAKQLFKRNRPPNAINGFKSIVIPSDYFSMPSGHTSAAFVTLVFLAYLTPLSLFATIPWATAIGASRIILGVHFPSDILAGSLLGSSCCIFIISAFH